MKVICIDFGEQPAKCPVCKCPTSKVFFFNEERVDYGFCAYCFLDLIIKEGLEVFR